MNKESTINDPLFGKAPYDVYAAMQRAIESAWDCGLQPRLIKLRRDLWKKECEFMGIRLITLSTLNEPFVLEY